MICQRMNSGHDLSEDLIMKKIIFSFIALILIASAVHAADIMAAQFSMKDQNDKTVSLQTIKGKVAVILCFDRDSMAQIKPWKTALLRKYGAKITILSAAYLRGIPFFVKGAAIDMIRKESGGTSTLLDWDGAFYSSYGLKFNTPNIVVIDKGGALRARESGAASGQPLEKVNAALDWSIKYSR